MPKQKQKAQAFMSAFPLPKLTKCLDLITMPLLLCWKKGKYLSTCELANITAEPKMDRLMITEQDFASGNLTSIYYSKIIERLYRRRLMVESRMLQEKEKASLITTAPLFE